MLPIPSLAAAHPAFADLLFTTFQDHAVLQREAPIPVWGITTAGAGVIVVLAKTATDASTRSAPIIGSTHFLHPTDKQDVGERLAFLTRNLIYRQSVIGVSPSPVAAWRARGEIHVRFDTHGGGLQTEESNRPIGFQLCDHTGHCAFADAMQHGSEVSLDSSATPDAVTVRYCWSDSPICNLYDREGLPAVPFELPIEPGAPDAGTAR